MLVRNVWSWDSSVSTVSDYRLGDQGSIPGRDKEFFLRPDQISVQTRSEAHPASCPMATDVLSSELKCGRGVTLTTHPFSAKVKNEQELYFPHVAYIAVTGQLYFSKKAALEVKAEETTYTICSGKCQVPGSCKHGDEDDSFLGYRAV
jgi:hypothetical protein